MNNSEEDSVAEAEADEEPLPVAERDALPDLEADEEVEVASTQSVSIHLSTFVFVVSTYRLSH